MTDNESKHPSAEFSRRSIIRNFALTAAGATATLDAIVGDSQMAAAQTKAAKSVVAYQDTPHEGQSCATCLQFEPPSGCKVVEGVVSPAGWCKVYVKKPA
jgi:High potential iron-sulfur protein